MSLQMAPEIEAKVRDLAAARGQSVDAVLNEALRLLQKAEWSTAGSPR